MRVVLLFAVLGAGCGAWRPRTQALIFEDSSAPLEYRADTAGAQRQVQGESCRNAIGLPLFFYGGQDLAGWGEAGYRDAVRKAQEKAPGASLSDVRADVHFINVLVFRRECLVVTAAVR
jgi:hypothetical protein